MPSLVTIGSVVHKLSMQFCYFTFIYPWKRSDPSFEPPLSKNAFCQLKLKFAQWLKMGKVYYANKQWTNFDQESSPGGLRKIKNVLDIYVIKRKLSAVMIHISYYMYCKCFNIGNTKHFRVFNDRTFAVLSIIIVMGIMPINLVNNKLNNKI